jgi:hypothetical protein
MYQGKTAGELCQKAASDSTKYNALEVGHALTNDIAEELATCALRHKDIFNEDEYCVGYVIASDPLLQNVMRRKFFAMLYLPSPRPNQAVFLYNKRWERFTKRLWTLPNALTMAELSEMTIVDPKYREMKGWCDAFYNFRKPFWQYIRDQHKITMLSESEYLKANREKFIQAGCKEGGPRLPDTLNFANVAADKIIHPKITTLYQDRFDYLRKTQDFNGSVCTHERESLPIVD